MNKTNTFQKRSKVRNTNEMSGVDFKECQRILDATTRIADEIYEIKKAPENFINEYFEGIKDQVISRRDSLKRKIKKYSSSMIQEINEAQTMCRSLTNKINDISIGIIVQFKESLNSSLKFLHYSIVLFTSAIFGQVS